MLYKYILILYWYCNFILFITVLLFGIWPQEMQSVDLLLKWKVQAIHYVSSSQTNLMTSLSLVESKYQHNYLSIIGMLAYCFLFYFDIFLTVAIKQEK